MNSRSVAPYSAAGATSLPITPYGGQRGEAYIHRMNGVTESVHQICRIAENQIAGVQHVPVTGGTGVPTSGLILGRA